MAANLPKKCCAEGFKHTGEPAGKLIDLNGIETYITGDESLANKKTLLFLTDILGHKFINSQLVADEYAKAGYFVVVPDLFEQDPAPLNPPKDFDMMTQWFPKHNPYIVGDIVKKVLGFVKAKWNPEFLVANGYCYTAKFILHLLGAGALNAAAIFHPSAITVDEFKEIKAPLYIGVAEVDQFFPPSFMHQVEAALIESKVDYRLTLNHNTQHGYAVRGDITDPWVKYAKEQAVADSVSFFNFVESL